MQHAQDGLFRVDAAFRRGLDRPVGLDALAQRVHRAGLLVVQGQRIQQGAVQDNPLRQQRRMIQGELLVILVYDGNRRGLRAGARGAGDSDVGQFALRQLVPADRLHASCQQQRLDSLGRVHRGTAAHGDQPVAAHLPVHFGPGYSIRQVGIGMIAAKEGQRQVCAGSEVLLHALAAHQHRAVHARFCHQFGDIGGIQAAPAPDDKLLHGTASLHFFYIIVPYPPHYVKEKSRSRSPCLLLTGRCGRG